MLSMRLSFLAYPQVTGDHPFTAEAIGRQVNLITLCTSHDVAEADGVEVKDIDILNDDRVQVKKLCASSVLRDGVFVSPFFELKKVCIVRR